jgi:phage shock protein PspC (stress-responsive transcriptional regulator)
MNKVITINLDGMAYQLEEDGYNALSSYLETAAARLQGNPDRDEILSDIERAIAEKFRSLLNSYKTVVVTKEVSVILAEMGPIEADTGTTAEGGAGGAAKPGAAAEEKTAGRGGAPRRLYRVQEGAMLAGVCNGMAVYAGIDPTVVRLAFILLTMLWGTGLLIYVVMAFVVPEALSAEQKASASGDPSTAQEFIRRARAGYYEALKGFPDRKARREWKRRFKREMWVNTAQWRYNWHRYWAEHASLHPGLAFMLPLLSLFHGMVTILWVCALVSLLSTSTVFGQALPANVPVWVAALLLFMAYGILVSPLKMARRAGYWGLGHPRLAWSFVFLLDALVWLAVVAALLWLASHFFPQLREAIQAVPPLAHQATDDIRSWWHGK